MPEPEAFDLGAIQEMVKHHPSSAGLTGSEVDWFMRDIQKEKVEEKEEKEEDREEREIEGREEDREKGEEREKEKNTEKDTGIERPDVLTENGKDEKEDERKEKGFFHKLKGRFRRDSEVKEKREVKSERRDSRSERRDSRSERRDSKIDSKIDRSDSSAKEPSSSPSPSETTLDDYVNFYKRKDIRRGSFSSLSRRSSVSEVSLDAPDFANMNPFDCDYKGEEEEESKMRFWRKGSDKGEKLARYSQAKSEPQVDETVLPQFRNLKPLKRVAFHSSTFLINPPQQIPSRNPRKGNVEVLPNGGIKINPLTEEDKSAIERSQMGQGGGIVVGGTGALKMRRKEEEKEKEKECTSDVNESDTEENKNENENIKDNENDNENIKDNDDNVSSGFKNISIDTPMVAHRLYEAPIKKMALDTLYTRCCHLREILPIPSILKQIPKGSMAPLSLLQLRNPAPTMIEVQTFADFIRIAPVICVSLDGVQLSLEQFKILLSAMSAKKQLEHLSLRNTPIDKEGWSLLCWFLSRNTVLHRLDITQCPSLNVNVLKRRKKKTDSESRKFEVEMERMSSNQRNRSDMDWELFVATLIARGGMEDLILTGCCITDVGIFHKLVTLAVSRKTHRLGLAYNKLTPEHLRIVVENWMFQDFARGLDLGFNDFSDKQMLETILSYAKREDFPEKVRSCSLTFLSLNQTNLSFDDFKQVMQALLIRLPRLKYLDLSNNPRMFEELAHVKYFVSQLPLFPILIRLHLQNNAFSTDAVLALAETIPFCKHLGYLSVVGNPMELAAGTALVQALKHSHSMINLDLDFDQFPDFFKEKVGLYSMRNMERLLYQKDELPMSHEAASESLTDQLNGILESKAQHQLDLSSPEVVAFVKRAHKVRKELQSAIDGLQKIQLRGELNIEGKETLIRFMFIDSSVEKGLMLIDPSLADDEHPYYKTMHGSSETTNTLRGVSEKLSGIAGDNLSGLDDKLGEKFIRPSASPLANSRSSSRLNLQSLDRQEGSVLKLSKLHDFHDSNSEYLFPSLSGVSGEDIRKILPSINYADLDKVIAYLDKLKAENISLEKVFSGDSDLYKEKIRQEGLEIEDIKKKLCLFANAENPGEYNPHESDIKEAYDQVLDSLAREKEKREERREEKEEKEEKKEKKEKEKEEKKEKEKEEKEEKKEKEKEEKEEKKGEEEK